MGKKQNRELGIYRRRIITRKEKEQKIMFIRLFPRNSKLEAEAEEKVFAGIVQREGERERDQRKGKT